VKSCLQKVNMCVANWFVNSRISIFASFTFHVLSDGGNDFCKKHLQLSNSTVNDWNNYLRVICVISLREK